MNQELRDVAGQERIQSDPGAYDEDFGASLRRAREQRGITLRSIAVSTKISLTFLEALEQNDVSRLPGGIFSRAFVRSYAHEVGLDPERAVKEFIERFPTEDAGHKTRHVQEFEESDQFESRRATTSVVMKLVGVSIPIAAAILYFTLSGDPGAEPQPELPAQAPAQAIDAPSSDRAPASISAGAASAVGGVAPAPPPGATGGTAGMLGVEIRTSGSCWVSVTADGRRSFARLMAAGEQELLQVGDEIVIEVGDAGNFSFSIDGVAGRSLGGPGEVVTARITAENYETFLRP